MLGTCISYVKAFRLYPVDSDYFKAEMKERPVFIFFFLFFLFFLFVVNFVIHWNETAMGLHVFPIPIPPPTSLSTRFP